MSEKTPRSETKRPPTIILPGISGCDKEGCLDRLVSYADKRGHRIKVYRTGEMVFEHARKLGKPLNPVNVLNADTELFAGYRCDILRQIHAEISSDAFAEKYDAAIIDIHGCFYWQDRVEGMIDRSLNLFDSADLVLMLIDDYRPILKRLNAREQWREQELTPLKVLLWQNFEFVVTKQWAESKELRFLVVPTAQRPSTLYRLIFHPEIEVAYVATPISFCRDTKNRRKIDRLMRMVDQYYVVIDPLAVEVVGAVKIRTNRDLKSELAVYHQIVHRDERWFVQEVDRFIAYWPKGTVPTGLREDLKRYPRLLKKVIKAWPEVICSPGKMFETGFAFRSTKSVWVVYEPGEASPFTTHYATHFFRGVKALLAHLKKLHPERAKTKW